MAAIKDEAIVLKRLDYSETSQVLVFLTREHGLCRLIAKGIKRGTKKKFSTGIDLLERGDLMFLPSAGGGLGTMTEWRQRDAHMGLRNDLHRLYGAQYLAEITAAMNEEGDPHAALYDGLAGALRGLIDAEQPLTLVVRYQRLALEQAGIWPDLTRCVFCDKPAPAGRAGYYAVHQGGLACRGCEASLTEKRKVSGQVLDGLRGDAITAETAQGMFDLLNYTISHAIGRQPSLARFVAG